MVAIWNHYYNINRDYGMISKCNLVLFQDVLKYDVVRHWNVLLWAARFLPPAGDSQALYIHLRVCGRLATTVLSIYLILNHIFVLRSTPPTSIAFAASAYLRKTTIQQVLFLVAVCGSNHKLFGCVVIIRSITTMFSFVNFWMRPAIILLYVKDG